MKRLYSIIILCAFALSLTACFSKQYMITTTAGETYTANGSPEYDVQTDTYKFEDDDGKKVILNQEDIQVIKEK
ncbi:YgdI/YgdR family lipoprotein [Pseudodesulfovibrio sp. JC047]|uniref:YgdI/YgdR family lipoprotein n=1 Tax=Pseudodesulfovibrio sp. JC047 TaxID=2683199 RepID=UPI0013D8B5B6|nr:YgdI/YgdR family lipoprotein [Pseudodesulfovibrio sp. JC047]NDV20162.1 YgdI/YgdR family lipoprotein [Pseudodesulfovibrio sp. JC047]